MKAGLIPKVCGFGRPAEIAPFSVLQREMNQLMNEFLGNTNPATSSPVGWFTSSRSGALLPSLDVTESETEVHVTAELPGLSENEIHVELVQDHLRIHGEKKDERTEKGHQFHRVERSFGAFERIVALPAEVDGGQVNATFKNGVLNVTLPKLKRGPTSQAIQVKPA